ncbi:coiled-coil domain-containing protein 172-like, partial [Lampetra planeri]
MSLDRLFEEILLTEQQLIEQSEKLREGTQAQQLSALSLQRDLMNKCGDQMLKVIEELLCQKSHLEDSLAKIKRQSKEEEENFLQEISRFNRDFSLRGNREPVFTSQTHTENQNLEKDVESLYKELETMSQGNSRVMEEKNELLLELQGLKNIQKDLARQLSAAVVTTQSLKAERHSASQRHLTDSTCLRLKEELKVHEEGDQELLWETLRSELQALQS